ncbi:MAG: heavy-metal-associated domain-containing protein [Cytophagaceae bacterium]|nr:heavy-metal-associated domain-containing protein [Cytophagaceae bacterium]
MKTTFVILFSLLLLQTSGLKAQPQTPSLTVMKAELQVNGLTCSMCNLSVYKALENVSFIDSIKTQLNSSVYTLILKPGEYLDPAVLRKQVEGAGFSVGKLRLFFQPVDVQLIKNDHLSYGGFYFHVLSSPNTKENWAVEIKDKKFVSTKEFNTLQKIMGHYTCYKTGITSDCCDGIESAKVIYHLSL